MKRAVIGATVLLAVAIASMLVVDSGVLVIRGESVSFVSGEATIAGTLALQGQPARVVALGKDADQRVVGEHHEGTDVLVGHHLESRVHRGRRRDREDITPFVCQDIIDVLHSPSLVHLGTAGPQYVARKSPYPPAAANRRRRSSHHTTPTTVSAEIPTML